MQQLVMNKKIIRGVIDFTENFNAMDILRNRETAGGFLFNRMRHISPLTEYHTEIFFQLLYRTPVELELIKKPSDYLTALNFIYRHWSDSKKSELKKLMEKEKLCELVKTIWEIVQETKLDEKEKIKLFCLLSAAYGLAKHTPDDEGFGITPEQAANAYRRLSEAESEEIKEIEFSDDVISIPARVTPYKIYLNQDEALKLLEKDTEIKITHKKIVAQKHIQGVQEMTVELEIHGRNGQITFRSLKPGETAFINAVNEFPVLVHPEPECGQNKDCNILSYAENYQGSYLTIKLDNENNGKIDDTNYIEYAGKGLNGESAAEVCFDGGYIYLSPDGIIHDENRNTDNTKHVTIEDYLRSIENEGK